MIFVTGATGLVGSYLLHSLLKEGKDVRAILYTEKNLERTRTIFKSLGSDPEVLKKVDWIKGDVLDVVLLEEAMQGVDQVYHCAAIVSFDPRDKNKMMKVNVEGTTNMVNAALVAGVKKLCYVSSIAALGRSEETNIIDENSEWKNTQYNSKYSKSKYLAEREVWRASAEGLPVVVVNPAIILGYGHPEKGSTRMFKTIYKNSLFYGRGSNSFVDVEDVVKAMILLMESDIENERFVVAAGNYSYKTIFSLIAKGFNKSVPKIAVPDFALELVWRFEAIRATLMNDKPLITKETANTSRHDNHYSNEKIRKMIDFEFRPIEVTISTLCSAMEPELRN
jgi:nucleoside-diphosphate-sugar epimerase